MTEHFTRDKAVALAHPTPSTTREALDWRRQATAWIRGKAAEQAQTNQKHPRHAECYPSWVEKVHVLERLACELDAEQEAPPFGLEPWQTATPPQVEPAPAVGINGLTQAETDATMSVRGLSEPAPSPEQALQRLSELGQQLQPEEFGMAPSTAGEREELLKALSENRLHYSDQSKLAALLQSTAMPSTAKEARWVRISEDGEGQENYCEECGAEPGASCTDVEGREWGRRVHAIRQEEPAALPVGELTPQMHLLDTPEPDKYVDFGEGRPLPMFHLSTLLQYGARLTASSQPVREPQPIVVGTETRFENGKLITRNLTAEDVYKPAMSPQNNSTKP